MCAFFYVYKRPGSQYISNLKRYRGANQISVLFKIVIKGSFPYNNLHLVLVFFERRTSLI